ncbi:MAG: phosphate signaling complex protein PhoU [Pseudomonadota bacterium]
METWLRERPFHKELNELKLNLLKMATLAEKSVEDSMTALIKRDAPLAKKVIAGDGAINSLEMVIDQQCLRLLALQQPMARDLRFITSAMKINTDLERIGDQAVNIAERAEELTKRPFINCCLDLPDMAEMTYGMILKSIDAFVNQDVQLAIEVCQKDDEVDALNEIILRQVLDFMATHTPAMRRAIHYIIIARCLERVADHSTNIAENVVYMVEGRVIKHGAYDS